MEAIKQTKAALDNRVPLIGFAGSPWTILCYTVQGQGSKNFDLAKSFCFAQPEAAHQLLQKITNYYHCLPKSQGAGRRRCSTAFRFMGWYVRRR